ncbi:hypothetical protein LOTGIDRAFT_155108 [Lottia gigantea]|uniref:Uncharacterized protein n=1 Tax=Lottia gigantea TaxID=225164 RepID=V4B9J7_LOTGI|nr:hypothetical protein LOTGIDRAFT_155108 [Lottia gigantea]ESO85619.1 hypothetical protein LOTGIDRAFT_155108 [Lottia gigantea]
MNFDPIRSTYSGKCQLSKIIVDHVMPKVIKWLTGNRLHDIMEGFKAFQGFPSLIRTLDSTHVPCTTIYSTFLRVLISVNIHMSAFNMVSGKLTNQSTILTLNHY